jgi:hypothetical protein
MRNLPAAVVEMSSYGGFGQVPQNLPPADDVVLAAEYPREVGLSHIGRLLEFLGDAQPQDHGSVDSEGGCG